MLMLVANTAFAGGGKLSPLAECVNAKSEKFCIPLYGNPYSPNYPFYWKDAAQTQCFTNAEMIPIFMNQVSIYGEFAKKYPWIKSFKKTAELAASGLILAQNSPSDACAVQANYDSSKPTYDRVKYMACYNEQVVACKA